VRERGPLARKAAVPRLAQGAPGTARDVGVRDGGAVMDPETLLDVLAALPGVHIAEKGTRRAYSGWPKVEVTLALDPREPTPHEFTVRIGEVDKPEPLPPNVTLERDREVASVTAEVAIRRAREQLANALGMPAGVVLGETPSWSLLLDAVRQLVRQAGEAVRTT